MVASHQLALAHGERMHRIPSERAWAEFQELCGKFRRESMRKDGNLWEHMEHIEIQYDNIEI